MESRAADDLTLRGCACDPGRDGIGGGERGKASAWLEGGVPLPGKLAWPGLSNMVPVRPSRTRKSDFPRDDSFVVATPEPSLTSVVLPSPSPAELLDAEILSVGPGNHVFPREAACAGECCPARPGAGPLLLDTSGWSCRKCCPRGPDMDWLPLEVWCRGL